MSRVTAFCLRIYCGVQSVTAIREEDDVPCAIPSALVFSLGLAQRKLAALHLCVLQELGRNQHYLAAVGIAVLEQVICSSCLGFSI